METAEVETEGVRWDLGELYSGHSSRILFITPAQFIKDSSRFSNPLSGYSHIITRGMLLNHELLKDAVVLDFGASNGRLSQAALSLGAKKVFLMEKEKREAQEAKAFLESDGWTVGEDGQAEIIEGDFTQPEFIRFIQRIENMNENIVVLINLGVWDEYLTQWGHANEVALFCQSTIHEHFSASLNCRTYVNVNLSTTQLSENLIKQARGVLGIGCD